MGTLPPASHGSCGTATDRPSFLANATFPGLNNRPLPPPYSIPTHSRAVLARHSLAAILPMKCRDRSSTWPEITGASRAMGPRSTGSWRGWGGLRLRALAAKDSSPWGVNIHAAIGQHFMVTVVPALSDPLRSPAPFLFGKWSSCRAGPAGADR